MMPAPGIGRMAFLDQDRRRARRIEHEELLTPLPDALLDQADCDAVFAERETHEARVRAEGMMEEREHRGRRAESISANARATT